MKEWRTQDIESKLWSKWVLYNYSARVFKALNSKWFKKSSDRHSYKILIVKLFKKSFDNYSSKISIVKWFRSSLNRHSFTLYSLKTFYLMISTLWPYPYIPYFSFLPFVKSLILPSAAPFYFYLRTKF